MRKNKFLLLVLLAPFLKGQVGINTETPPSTLTVNGSIQGAFKEIDVASYSLTDQDFYLSYTGTVNATFTLPDLSTITTNPSGRVYKIKNTTSHTINITALNKDLIIGTGTDVTSFTLAANNYVEITAGTRGVDPVWLLSFTGKTGQQSTSDISGHQNVEIYGAQLTIPPNATFTGDGGKDFTNHEITKYDTADWWVISKQSFPVQGTSEASRMIITYEYQGAPFDITNLYPILTSGNNSDYPDVLVSVVKKLENVNNKTQLVVSVVRVDLYMDWSAEFYLNVLLAKVVN